MGKAEHPLSEQVLMGVHILMRWLLWETIQWQESGLESCCSQPETCPFSKESLPQGNTVLGLPGHDGLFLVLLGL